MYDKVKDLYDFLTNEGYDFMGSEDEFRGKLQDGAKAGELYSFLTNEGYDFMGTYDEFISKVGAPYNTAAANRAAGVDEASNRAQEQQAQRNMGTPGVVPNRFGLPTQQGAGPVAPTVGAQPTPRPQPQQEGTRYNYMPMGGIQTPAAEQPAYTPQRTNAPTRQPYQQNGQQPIYNTEAQPPAAPTFRNTQKVYSDAAEKAWQKAEQDTKTLREANTKKIEDIYNDEHSTMLGKMAMAQTRATALPIEGMAASLKAHDMEKMADDAWGYVSDDDKEYLIDGFKREIMREAARSGGSGGTMSQEEAEKALREEAERRAKARQYQAMYDKAVAANAPKDVLDFLTRKIVEGNSLSKLAIAAARTIAGTRGDMDARAVATHDYGKGHRVADIAGSVLQIATDPVTWAAGGAGKGAVKGATAIAERAAGAAATRKLAASKGGQLAQRIIGGSGNFAAFEGLGNIVEQLQQGGVYNEETGQYEYSLKDVAKAAGHGVLLGGATGIAGGLVGNVGDKIYGRVASTGGKLAVRGGQTLTSIAAEGTIFAAPELISGEGDFDTWLESVEMMAGFKLNHGIKALPGTLGKLVRVPESRAGFETRLRTLLDNKPGLALTNDEREELESKGYGDLSRLVEAYKGTEGKLVRMGDDMPYDRFSQLMADNSISEAARAKMYYYVTGRGMVQSTVVAADMEPVYLDGNLVGYEVKSYNNNNGVITSRRYKSEKEAKVEFDRLTRQSELNSIDMLEKLYGRLPGIETPAFRLREEVGGEYGVDIDKALGKERSRRSDKEQKAIDEYVGELSRSCQEVWDRNHVDINQQRIDERWSDAEYAAETNAEAVREAYKPMTREDGSIHPVVLNVEGADGQPKTVYLLDGSDVVLNPDGSIDHEKSSPTLTAYDPEQGKNIFIDDPYGDRGIQSVGEVTTPEALDQLAGGGVDGQDALNTGGYNGQGARIPIDGQGARAPERTPGAPEAYTPGMVMGVVDNAGQEHVAEIAGRVRYDKGKFVPDENGMFVEYTVDGQTKHEAADKLNDMVRWHETGGVDTIEPIEGIEGQAPTAEQSAPQGSPTGSPTQTAQQTGAAAQPQAEDTRTPAQRTFDEVTAKYGDKASHKVDVTLKDRKATLDGKKKALDKAQTDYDDAPIGKEDKAEAALAKAQEEYDNALADYNSWDAVRKLRDQALLAQAEQEEQQRKAEEERRLAEETEAQRKQREAYEAEQARRKAEAEAVEKRRQEENARLRAEEEERKNNPQPAVEPAPIEGTKGQASQLEIARQEMADDPGALAMLEDMSPRTLEEVASRLLSSGKNQVRLIKDDFMRETGYTPEDVKRYPFVFATADKGGITLSRFGEMVAAEARNNGIPFDENDPMAGVTAALNMLGGVGSQGDINGYVAGSRIQQAYDYHNTALAAERANMLEAYGMTDEEYESYMSWLEDAIEQGKSTLSDEEFNQIFDLYGQGQTTDAAGGNQEGAETTERTESAETDVSQNGERGNGETDAGTAEQPQQPAVGTEQQPKAETWEEHVNKAMEAYDKEYAAIEKSDGERLRKEAAGYSDERLRNTYIRNAGISQIFGKGREGMRKFVSEEKNYNADKLDEAKENHLEAAPDAARQSFVQDVLRAELDRRGIEYKEDYTFAETSKAEDWYKKNVEGKAEQPRAAVGEEAAPKQNIADVEAGGAIVDKLEQMGVEVSADIAENRRVRKQAENDKSENGKIHELRTTDGKVYGFAYRGKLYLDPRKIDAELPLHEYAHLWTEAMRILNPKKWAEVVEQIKQDKDAWQFIHSTYPDLKTDSEIADEVIATFSGKNGAEKLKAALDRFTQNNPDYKSRWNAIYNSIAKALQDFWKAVGDFLNIKYESAQQIYDQVLKDFVSGMNPRARVEKYLQERETAYMQAAERGDVAKATEIFNQALSEEIGNGMTPFIAAGRYDRASRIPTLAHKVKSRDPKAIDEVAELIAPIIPNNAVLVPAPSHNGRATDMLDLAKAIAKRTGSEVADVLTSEPRDSQYETKKRGGLIASQDMGITMTGTLPEGKIPVVIDNVVGSGNTAEACVRAIGKGLVVSLGDAADRYNHAVSLKSAAPILRDRNNNIVPLSKRFNLGGSQYLGRSAYERADGKAARVSAKERKLRDAIVDLLRKAGIDVVTESEEGQRVLDMANGRERQHRVYHGSGADFEAFDHTHMGEGEGAQAFGWGTYVTEVEGIGKKYANDAVSKDSPYQIVEYVGEKTDTESLSHAKAIAPLFNGGSRDWNGVLEFLEQTKESPRTQRHIEWFKKTRPEDWKSANDGRRTLYTVEIPEDNGSNYLDWNEPIKQKQLTKIASALAKEKGKEYGDYLKEKKGSYGENIYYELYTALGSQQAASELLHSAGFVGVKYPAEYYSGGRSDGAKNYVIFDEGDLQITDKVKFFRTEDGEAYGFTMGGKIYLDPKIATAETPIHEYTHLWAAAMRAANPKAWEQLKSELEKDKDLMAYVQRLYPELKGDELMDEVFAHFSGRRGAERLRAEQERMEGETRSIVGKAKVIAMFENLRNALKKFWNAARELFGGKVAEGKSKEDFADMVLGDLVSGFNPSTDSDVRFRGEEEPVFYSNAMRAVENIKQERATPEQWVKMIEKQGGMKAGEDKWLGLSEWLKGSDAKTLTKGEVLDYIRANEIQIEEVEYGDAANNIAFEALKQNYDTMLRDNGYDYAWEQLREQFGDDAEIAFTDVGGELEIANAEAAAALLGSETPINETRLEYTTEGLDNKREIVLTVPTIEPWNEHDEVHFGEAGGGRAVAWVRFGETTDADGKRVLVIDEIQSKRHQEGREKGYKNPNAYTNATIGEFRDSKDEGEQEADIIGENGSILGYIVHVDGEGFYAINKDGTHMTSTRMTKTEALKALQGIDPYGSTIPDAPFEKNWHEVAMKRMLRFAAENGYDKVAWTKGEQQAERYDLGEVVDFLYIDQYSKDEPRFVNVRTVYGSPFNVYFDNDGVVVKSEKEELAGKNLADIFGKELANKIVKSENGTNLAGDDLRIGGEGMKGFYDQILPRFMDKYGKKWGVKTGEVRLDGLSGSNGENGVVMHAVDVTDDMRESVMRGQPLFRPKTQSREGGEEAAQGDWYDRGSVERIGEFAGYTPKRIAAMNARQEQTARNKFRDAAEKLHLGDRITFVDTIDEIEGIGEEQRKAWRRKKGWYSPRTGKIVIILGNHKSMDDVMKSILHEGVAHHGLRQMFGVHFDTFLDNVYLLASSEIRERINDMAKKHGWDFREATEEYLATLAEDTDFERPENQSWWKKVKAMFIDLLHKIGFRLHDVYDTITDNELRYILWRSYENLVHPGRYNSVVEEAKDVAKQYELKVGRWDVEWTIEDREPDATTVYNGRRIAVWATNGRRGNREDRADRTDRTDMVDRKEWIRAVAEAKRHWPGAMVLEHVGDFYVIHGEDARKVAKVLGLPLVQRSGNDTVGFPAYAVDTYLPKLVRAGERVAVVDSVNEDAVVYGGENIRAENAAEYAKHRRTAEAIKERFPEPLTMRNYKSWEIKNYLAHILGMGGWINDIHREIPYRFLHPKPTLDDYFKDTIATFKSIGKVPEDDTPNKLLAAQRVNMTRWEKMKESGKYEHHQSPLSNSEYLVDRETGDIYRLSDHWGKVASCDWNIDQRHGGERGIMQIGKCNITEFSPKNKNGKNVVINPAYIKALTEATSVAKENYRTFLDNVEMTDAVRRDVESQITELEKNLEREIGNFGDNGIRFRDGDFSERDEVTARDYYERMVSSSGYQFREAVQDSMLGLRKAYEAILGGGKKFRIEEVPGNENAYLAENRMSSVNAAEHHNYFVECMKPLLEEIHKICGSDKALRQELTDYMMAKHGLERNRVFAERDAQNGQGANNGQGARIPERDYAGLTALTGMADVHDAELAAMQMVADFEARHDVSKLWEATKKATGVTLAKIYLSGMLSKESYEQIRDQFEWYIPLQGFDETTSDEVYGYLTSRQGPYGSPIKHAEGRSSKADDPIATIGMMADMAIRQANRNEMKKLFLNFVLDHPSDLVSVNRLWLQYDDVNDEWVPVFADIEEGDTAADVERKVAAFEQRMEQLAAAEPDKYKHGRNAKNIPYRVLPGNLSEHQVLVKRDGETYVLTINGNPRAAQALNGLTNPDVKVGGVVGDMMKAAEWVNHNLSAAYTTRTPDFVVSNYFRDMLYSNCMTWVKEGGNYALRFHKNFGKFNPATMRVLFGKWEKGTLDESKPIEFMFKQFMLNGGETGYTNVRDIEAHKREIARELKRQGNKPLKAWHALGMQLDLLNRSVENCARFAAFITSQEMGRSVERSIYDAKEVSVNFNKKGSGGKMVNATGQTGWGKFGSYLSGTGRLLYVFWNAGTQGMTNFMRAAKHHPGKFSAGAAATMFALGAIIPLLAKAIGDDDDDENAYYNLPEYVRRSNICFRFTKEMPWITIPLPIEFRAIYGLGELGTGLITGDEHYNNWELARQLTSQVSQMLPLDFMEGGGGLHAFIPSLAKPIVEAATNKSWTGLPIYRDNPFNQKDPEFTKVYKNADKNLVAASKWLNELTGGDDYKKGWADKVNPAQVEYVLNGYLGGWFKVPNQLMKMGETAFGDREFEWRNMMLANRLIKNGDERTANRKLQNEYFELKDEYEETKRLLKKYKNAADEGVLKYAEKLAFLNESEEYGRYLIFDEYRKEIDKLYKQMKKEEGEQRKATEEEYYSVVREMVDKVHEYNKGR